MEKLLKKSKADRFSKEQSAEKKEAIEIAPEWEALLKEFPQVSEPKSKELIYFFIQFTRSRGRMLNLMKEGSKVGLAKKSRKKHQALLPAKKMKEEPFDFSAEMKELNQKGAD